MNTGMLIKQHSLGTEYKNYETKLCFDLTNAIRMKGNLKYISIQSLVCLQCRLYFKLMTYRDSCPVHFGIIKGLVTYVCQTCNAQTFSFKNNTCN